MKTAQTEAYWQDFKQATGSAADEYVLLAFGDSPEMADELGRLTLDGKKRATAGLLRSFTTTDEPLPRVGDHVLVVDGKGTPLCIYRSTEVRIGPLSSVDEQFAWDEGEGDRTRTWWLAAHQMFFAREAARDGFAMHDDIETVFERFEVVWPPEAAARNQSSR